MSPQGVRVREDAKFLLSQRLRSSSQLNGELRETSHQRFRSWFRNHTDVCNGALISRSIPSGLFSRCLSELETRTRSVQDLPVLKAKVWSCAALRWLDPCALQGWLEETQRAVNQRHSAASVTAVLQVLLFLSSSVVSEYFTGSPDLH